MLLYMALYVLCVLISVVFFAFVGEYTSYSDEISDYRLIISLTACAWPIFVPIVLLAIFVNVCINKVKQIVRILKENNQ